MTVLQFSGKIPQIPASCFVAPSATVIGDVIIGAEASVWYGSVLRADIDQISIGPMTNIQDHCVIHLDHGFPVRIGSSVTVGHRAVIHGCTIGDRTLIGMGAIIMNGVEIGEESIIGAGALIPEGKKVPPRSVVMGVPGKIVRQVSEEQVKTLIESAEHYAGLAKLHQLTCSGESRQ